MVRSLLVVGSVLLACLTAQVRLTAQAAPTDSQVPVFRLSGAVLDAREQPVGGVLARFWPRRGADPNDAETVSYAATSDASGAFEITIDTCESAGRLTLSKDGFASTIFDRIPSVSPLLALGGLRILPPVTFGGTLLDEAGKAIPGGRVHLLLEPDAALAARHSVKTATSDTAGRFAFDGLPPAQLTLEVDALGFETRCESIDLRDPLNRERNFTLRAADPARGRVLDPAGQPLAKATVSRHDERFPALFAEIETTTDEAGRFTLPTLRASDPKSARPYLLVRASGFPVTRHEFDADAKNRDVQLDSGLPATLTLLEADGSAAEIESIHYSVFTKAGDGWSHQDGDVRRAELIASSAPGAAPNARRFALPRGDRGRVFAQHRDGRQSKAIELDLHTIVKDGFELKLVLPALSTLTGTVVGPTGQPVAGIRVELGRIGEQSFFPLPERATLCDTAGRFEFSNMRPGSWSLRAISDDALSDPIPTMLGENDPAPILLKAARGPRLRGTLKINDLAPARAVGLLALRFQRQGAQGSYIPIASTLAAEGKYELAALPLGAFALEPLRLAEPGDGCWHDFKATLDAIDPRGSKNQISIVEAAERTLDVNVRHEARGFVSGALSINGRARGGVRLSLTRQVRLGAPPTAPIPAITDGYGRFRTRLMGPALYRVEALVGTMRAAREFEFDPGQELELALEFAAGSIRGVFDLEAGSPGPFRAVLEGAMTQEELAARASNPTNVDDTPWATRAETVVDAAGNYRFAEIQTGTFRIALEDTSRTLARVASSPFDVVAGGETEVTTIAAGRGGVIEALLVKPETADRFPFASLRVSAAEGASQLPRTFVGWFVSGVAQTDGVPKAKVRVEVIVYGPFVASAPQEVEIDPDAGPTRLTFQISPKP